MMAPRLSNNDRNLLTSRDDRELQVKGGWRRARAPSGPQRRRA